MYIDYHVHSSFSSDGRMSMEECIESAIDKNIEEMCFTDHVDIDYPGYGTLDFIYEDYIDSIKRNKDKKAGLININIGVEMGLRKESKDKINEYLSSRYFDFVIGSFHSVGDSSFGEVSYYRDRGKYRAYADYFEYMYDTIKVFDNFDVLGHIDIIKRYSDFEDKTLFYASYRDMIDPILKELIYKGKGIEINTSGKRYGLDCHHPGMDIIKAYRELGGEIITTGSDSHYKEHLAYDFKDVYEMLKECGFDYVTKFNNRKPIQMKI